MRGRGREWRWRGCSRRAVRFLEPTLLLLLHHSPAHGYTLLERLREFGLEGLNPSVVYRALRDMEGRGWISSTWDEEQTHGPPRRVYCLTGLGDEALGLWTQDLQETRGLIDRLVGTYSRHMEEGEGEHH
ncbi:MAG: helix-turn-helix transcriptional regulator [Anaerolineae bacterium]|nr:helix-turn-helix transcriptional regulator [Anaerolineae bacterium]MCK4449352.1 helix-turn-helix transcriptional regulator [Anaerolineae bacterium]